MTSRAKIEANRKNAAHSTGPKTREGKDRSARNAQRHGVTSLLPQSEILFWYRLILDDAEATIDPCNRSPRARCALELAEAQACLQRAQHAEEMALRDMIENISTRSRQKASFLHGRPFGENKQEKLSDEEMYANVLAAYLAKQREKELRIAQKIEAAGSTAPTERDDAGTLKLLTRYRREAEGRRRRALKRWIDQ